MSIFRAGGMMAELSRLDMSTLDPQLAAALAPRVARLGYLGEFFQVMGHQPKALMAFMTFTEEAKGGLPPNLIEVVALTVAGATGNDYERCQHERLSVKLGLKKDWVEAVNALRPDDQSLLTDHEQGVQHLALAAAAGGAQAVPRLLGEVVEAIGAEAAVAVLFLIGRYLTHSFIVQALELQPPVSSIFDEDDP